MHVVCLQANMDLGSMLYNNLKDVSWSTTSLPLDRLVSVYRLPQIVKLDSGELVDVLRDNDYLLIHSCRQWTTITAHSLEEGHYVIGPKIEIPVHYEGQFKLLEQDRDVKEPVQYFNSVEEVAKAFPERVYVMEEITFNVKMASGECNEDTEVYNITLSTGDELTLMGQAEILYAKASKEKSRFNTIFKKIGKLNSISKIANRGKMPCLICMNHRTNESVSLPFQCKGRFSTCSPLELQMLEGEHTIRNIVENTRLPVNVSVPGSPPRNQHDVHLIRESHRYKLVNIQTKTVVVGCVLRSNKIIPVHFPLHMASMPKFIIPEGLLQNELWLDTMVHRWFTYCQEQFDIDDYSRAVRDVRTDWNDVEGRSPKKSSGSSSNSSNGCSSHMHMPSSLTYARDELTQSFHRLSVCVYGNNLHSNSEVNLQGCMTLCGDWVLLPSEGVPADSVDTEYLFPELLEDMSQSDVPYEELWLDHLRSSRGGGGHSVGGEDPRGTSNTIATSMAVISYPVSSCHMGPMVSSEICLAPPPVPPKSEAVKVECRHLNAPPIPPRSSKQMMSTPTPAVAKARQTETRSPSPTLSYYSSGLHSISGGENEVTEADEQNHVCYPCNWVKGNEECLTASHVSPPLDGVLSCPSRLSWPNDFYGGDSQSMEEFLPIPCQSYYSYPRKRPSGTPKSPCTSSLFDLDRKEQKGGSAIPLKSHKASYTNQFCTKSSSYTLEMYRDNMRDECNTKQSLSCPILPPRTTKSNETCKDSVEDTAQDTLKCLVSQQHDQVTTTEIFSISYPPLPPLSSPSLPAPGGQWQPPTNLSGLSIEEVSKSLRFIGISGDIVSSFVTEKIDGNLLLQLTEEILTEDFKLSKLQVKKLMQFIKGWRPKI
ncbi:GRB2-associated and regulator of MAPK protein 1-like isoform X1 [Salvelinus alpinus]|uniref:GRB2-associated and regulator of MAPK protein 1-like isoform X1 n=3 Tax=Salvelinus alpinus TaxID=8036 RepID=UPI0039FD2A5F